MAGRVCSMYHCSNRNCGKNGKSLHRFPKDEERCAHWTQCCKRSDLDDLFKTYGAAYMYENHRLCSDHFETKCFMNPNNKKAGLIRGSVPSVNLPVGFSNVTSSCRRPKFPPSWQKVKNSRRFLPLVLETPFESLPDSSQSQVQPTGNGSRVCPHYVAFIEEKAKCHKLQREVENLKEELETIKRREKRKLDILIRESQIIKMMKMENNDLIQVKDEPPQDEPS